jgi:hypothetical protein
MRNVILVLSLIFLVSCAGTMTGKLTKSPNEGIENFSVEGNMKFDSKQIEGYLFPSKTLPASKGWFSN